MNGLQSLKQWENDFNHPTGSTLGLLNAIQVRVPLVIRVYFYFCLPMKLVHRRSHSGPSCTIPIGWPRQTSSNYDWRGYPVGGYGYSDSVDFGRYVCRRKVRNRRYLPCHVP